jgi:hypothetical protein
MDNSSLTYIFLLEFYLREQVYGTRGNFNKRWFPNDYERIEQELEYIINNKHAVDKWKKDHPQ